MSEDMEDRFQREPTYFRERLEGFSSILRECPFS